MCFEVMGSGRLCWLVVLWLLFVVVVLLACPFSGFCVIGVFRFSSVILRVVFCFLLCSAVLVCSLLCCAVLCCAVLCCAVLCCALLCCAVLCCSVLFVIVLCCAVLHCSLLFCFFLCSFE